MSEMPAFDPGDLPAGDSGAWTDEFAAGFLRAIDELEDAEDAREADEAWDEPGESIPLAGLIAELALD